MTLAFLTVCNGTDVAQQTLLHCLGSGGYYPNDRRHTSCYFVPTWGLVLDAGTGIFRLPELIQTDRIDILLSHCHLDHVFGLTVLLEVMYRRPMETINVWGQPEKLVAIQKHLLHSDLFPVPIPVHYKPVLNDQPVELPHCQFETFPQSHPGGSIGFRIQSNRDGANLVYATDTVGDASKSFADFAQSTDLLIHECYFHSDHQQFAEKTGHTHTDRLIEVTRAVRPKQLLITHVSPMEPSDDPVGLSEIRSAVNVDVELAVDEKVIRFGGS